MQRAIFNQGDSGFGELEHHQPGQTRPLYSGAPSAAKRFGNQNTAGTAHPSWTTGIAAIDQCLPLGGLSRAGLHEIEPLRPSSMPFMTGFVFGLLSRLRSHQPIIWCGTAAQIGKYGHPYAFGLERYGISPAQIIFAKVRHTQHFYFALEEAVKTEVLPL